uniref:Major facilitator superfamily (MFS) profile domain-containing protein n=1 Tax=Bionectria ochroleuca TaxID=29856 RepID=A0A0B7K9R7_BIOOC
MPTSENRAPASALPNPSQKADKSPLPVEHKEYGEVGLEGVGGSAIDPHRLARTIRKMDIVVLPIMTVILAFCFIDRTNMGLAMVVGMGSELRFDSYGYSTALLVFFPGYALFVLPSNYILSKTSVRYWLTFLSLAFGFLTLAAGLVRTFGGLVAVRALLGICEAGVFPTIIVVASSWYPRYYFGKRMTAISSGASLISALSGVLAWAFSRISTPNHSGWRYIFILEGAITVLAAFCAFFAIDEYPNKSRFLSEEQRDIAVRLIAQDREEREEEEFTFSLGLRILRDWKIWVFGILYMLNVATTYGLAYFIPLILNGKMGFSGAISQLLSTPPYFYGFILAVTVSSISDRYHIRSPFIIFLHLNVILGITLMRWGPNTASQYLGLFFCLGASVVSGPMIVVYGQNNAPTRAKRSVSSGVQLSLGAVGGIIGSTVFRSQDSPTYTPGTVVVLCSSATVISICCLLNLYFRRLNRLQRETNLVLEGQRGFLYTL